MSSQMAEAIRQLIQEKGLPEKAVLTMIEDTLKAAYKRKFGTCENAVVEFAEDLSEVYLYSKKIVVDGAYDLTTEIELEDAKKLGEDFEVGDEIAIQIDPKDFDRSIIQTGKQTARQSLSEIQKDRLFAAQHFGFKIFVVDMCVEMCHFLLLFGNKISFFGRKDPQTVDFSYHKQYNTNVTIKQVFNCKNFKETGYYEKDL